MKVTISSNLKKEYGKFPLALICKANKHICIFISDDTFFDISAGKLMEDEELDFTDPNYWEIPTEININIKNE